MTQLLPEIGVLYQDISSLTKVISGIDQRVEHLRKTLRVDDVEAQLRDSNSRAEVTRALNANTEMLTRLVLDERRRDLQDVPDSGYYRGQLDRRAREVRKNLAYIQELSKLRQERVSKCPQGHDHGGIVFLRQPTAHENLMDKRVYVQSQNKYGVVMDIDKKTGEITVDGASKSILAQRDDLLIIVDHLCPKDWWIKQSRLAFENRVLMKFVNETPLTEYLAAF